MVENKGIIQVIELEFDQALELEIGREVVSLTNVSSQRRAKISTQHATKRPAFE